MQTYFGVNVSCLNCMRMSRLEEPIACVFSLAKGPLDLPCFCSACVTSEAVSAVAEFAASFSSCDKRSIKCDLKMRSMITRKFSLLAQRVLKSCHWGLRGERCFPHNSELFRGRWLLSTFSKVNAMSKSIGTVFMPGDLDHQETLKKKTMWH